MSNIVPITPARGKVPESEKVTINLGFVDLGHIDLLVSERLGVHRNDLRCLHLLEQRPATPGEVAVHTRLTSGS